MDLNQLIRRMKLQMQWSL